MADFKKFLFDNFVVGEEEKEKFSEDAFDYNEQETDFDKQEDFSTLQKDIKDLEQNESEEKAEEKQIFKPSVVDVSSSEKDKLIADFEQKIKTVREEGYQEGFSACRSSAEAMSLETLKKIEQVLKVVYSELDEKTSGVEKECVELLSVGLRKIVPNLLAENAKEIVSDFMKQNFENIRKEPKLSFYIHPDVAAAVQTDIAELARVNDFEGKISIHKDATLQISDCRIEWESGGVERNSEEILNKVENFLGSNK